MLSGDSAGGNMAAVTALRVRDEGGPAFRQVMEGNSTNDPSTSGESHNADTVRGNSPFCGVPPNVRDGR